MNYKRGWEHSQSSDSYDHIKKKHKHKKDHQNHKHHRHHDLKLKTKENKDKYSNRRKRHNNTHQFQQKYQHYNEYKHTGNTDQINNKKQKPCFEPSGILLQFYNARDGVALKFHEPPEAHAPKQEWRLYVFKGQEALQPILLQKSCYLIGTDERVCDILCENPSVSKQHAVIQFRTIYKRNPISMQYDEAIKPYLMDLQSTNGTIINGQAIENSKYIELLHKDIIKFAYSSREYVIVKIE